MRSGDLRSVELSTAMNREAMEKRQAILLMGAIDMDHVVAAAEAIQREHATGGASLPLLRALETAVAVCYWRPFSQSNRGVGHLGDKMHTTRLCTRI
jgi:hypothetical protein